MDPAIVDEDLYYVSQLSQQNPVHVIQVVDNLEAVPVVDLGSHSLDRVTNLPKHLKSAFSVPVRVDLEISKGIRHSWNAARVVDFLQQTATAMATIQKCRVFTSTRTPVRISFLSTRNIVFGHRVAYVKPFVVGFLDFVETKVMLRMLGADGVTHVLTASANAAGIFELSKSPLNMSFCKFTNVQHQLLEMFHSVVQLGFDADAVTLFKFAPREAITDLQLSEVSEVVVQKPYAKAWASAFLAGCHNVIDLAASLPPASPQVRDTSLVPQLIPTAASMFDALAFPYTSSGPEAQDASAQPAPSFVSGLDFDNFYFDSQPLDGSVASAAAGCWPHLDPVQHGQDVTTAPEREQPRTPDPCTVQPLPATSTPLPPEPSNIPPPALAVLTPSPKRGSASITRSPLASGSTRVLDFASVAAPAPSASPLVPSAPPSLLQVDEQLLGKFILFPSERVVSVDPDVAASAALSPATALGNSFSAMHVAAETAAADVGGSLTPPVRTAPSAHPVRSTASGSGLKRPFVDVAECREETVTSPLPRHHKRSTSSINVDALRAGVQEVLKEQVDRRGQSAIFQAINLPHLLAPVFVKTQVFDAGALPVPLSPFDSYVNHLTCTLIEHSIGSIDATLAFLRMCLSGSA